MNGAEAIVKELIAQDATTAFGFPGGAVIPLYDEFLNVENQFRHILVRHEQCAAHAATAYARVLGKPGICLATSGPGSTNLVTGIMDAYMDSVPMIAFGGQVPSSLIGNDAFQETDMMGITMPITKHNYQLRDPNLISTTIQNAFKIANQGRPGPVYIDLPKDMQSLEVKNPKTKELRGFKPNLKGHPKQIKAAAEMILKAERPLIISGGGVISANASEPLAKLATSMNIPVATTMMGKGSFPESHALALGMLGMHGRKTPNYAVTNADLILAIGCRFSDRITGNLQTFAAHAKVIHIDVDSAEIGKNVAVDLPIVGDAKLILTDLNSVLQIKTAKEGTEWSEKIKQFRKECQCNMNLDSNPIEPKKLLFELNKVMREDDILTTGVGQQQMFAAHFIERTKPRTFISSGGAGTMGYGLPSAIGAKVAKPEARVFDFDGDGSFAMTQQELATSREEKIPVIPVIMNNEYLGMVRQWLELFFDKRYSGVHLKKTPNFTKLAEAYSLTGIEVTRASEIAPALEQAVKSDETTVIDVHVAEESNILPMFSAGASVNEMFGPCMQKKGEFF